MLTENDLTVKELQFLSVLFLLTKGGKYAVAGLAIAFWTGGNWTTYRHRKMKYLEKQGWVICQKIPYTSGSKRTRWFYHLTDEANAYLDKSLTRSLHGNRYDLMKPLEW